MANQIKRHNVSSLTYENFPGGHPSQYRSHPCTLNSTIIEDFRFRDVIESFAVDNRIELFRSCDVMFFSYSFSV
ncbi:hypothetical protein F511_36470 [Dorcoceras hygrometricum]|uniref:Uncharacterized protein n=1 Tax=Dorcoceras hygrometricum TaxID=472368 RepID=A0A2Z7AS55_9LAMI|nr:hypothetical protein F511_36470 [Dorcoceras hygrometricum]